MTEPYWEPLAAAASVSYGTTLPASPVDGQEFILTDSLTAPNWAWRFRYNAGSSYSEKWEFIGGFPKLLIGGSTSQTLAAAAAMVPGWGTITVPRTGTYWTSWSAWASAATFPAHISSMGVWTPGVGQQGTPTRWASGASSGVTVDFSIGTRNVVALTTGQVLGMAAFSGQAPTWTLDLLRLELIPVRVS